MRLKILKRKGDDDKTLGYIADLNRGFNMGRHGQRIYWGGEHQEEFENFKRFSVLEAPKKISITTYIEIQTNGSCGD